MIYGCNPHDSPTFLHGRPETVSFDVLFNTRPYMADREIKDQDIGELSRAIKLKAAVVALTDAERTDIQLAPSELVYSQKEYAEEFHVTVKFDISEFERSATEKLVYAQLTVHEGALVNSDKTAFTTEKHLSARGLPIYVFESTDEEQIIVEESSEV